MHQVVIAPESYIAVHGRLTFDTSKLPQTDWGAQQNTPALTRISGRLSGHSLSKSGFTAPFKRTITIEVRCLGPWCASPPSGNKMLAFLKQTSSGYTLDFGPCHSNAFNNPTPEMLKTVKRCYLHNRCPNRS